MTYEVIYEIFNECANNQMRDIFFEEREFEAEEMLENYVKSRHEGRISNLEKTVCDDGGIIFDFDIAGVKQRYSFTPTD